MVVVSIILVVIAVTVIFFAIENIPKNENIWSVTNFPCSYDHPRVIRTRRVNDISLEGSDLFNPSAMDNYILVRYVRIYKGIPRLSRSRHFCRKVAVFIREPLSLHCIIDTQYEDLRFFRYGNTRCAIGSKPIFNYIGLPVVNIVGIVMFSKDMKQITYSKDLVYPLSTKTRNKNWTVFQHGENMLMHTDTTPTLRIRDSNARRGIV